MKKAKGKREYEKHLRREQVTRTEAMLAMCYQCQGYYKDGVSDCTNESCPLYPYMPYGTAQHRAKKPRGNPDSLRRDNDGN